MRKYSIEVKNPPPVVSLQEKRPEVVEVVVEKTNAGTAYVTLYFENGRHVKILGIYDNGTVQTLDFEGKDPTKIEKLKGRATPEGYW